MGQSIDKMKEKKRFEYWEWRVGVTQLPIAHYKGEFGKETNIEKGASRLCM